MVTALLAHPRIQANKAANDGTTALYVASHKNHIDVVRALAKVPTISANRTVNNVFTPLYAAAYSGHVEAVKVVFILEAN